MRPHLNPSARPSHTNNSVDRRSTPRRKRPRTKRHLDNLVPDWLADLELLGRSASTRRMYRAVLKTLLMGITLPSELTRDRVRRIAHERLEVWKPQSVRTGVKVLQSFCGWLVREGYLTENPVTDLPRPALEPGAHRILTREETSALWRATNNEEERLLLALLLDGLRASELCSLQWSDVDYVRSTLNLRATKGRRPRMIPLPPRVARLLNSQLARTKAVLAERHQRLASCADPVIHRRRSARPAPLRQAILKVIGDAGRALQPRDIDAALNANGVGSRAHMRTLLHRMRMLGLVSRSHDGFLVGNGEPVSRTQSEAKDDRIFQFGPHTLRQRVAGLGLRAGIAHVHPHLLRHTFASHFRLEGGDEASLMALGGWSSVEMARYYGRSVLSTVAMRRSRELDLTERLIGGAAASDSESDVIDRLLEDPRLREQLLVRLLTDARQYDQRATIHG